MIFAILVLSITTLIAICALVLITAPRPNVIKTPDYEIYDDKVVFDFRDGVKVVSPYELESDGEGWFVRWGLPDFDTEREDFEAVPYLSEALIDDEVVLEWNDDRIRETDHFNAAGEYAYHGVDRRDFV
jgi:hypothetical protein